MLSRRTSKAAKAASPSFCGADALSSRSKAPLNLRQELFVYSLGPHHVNGLTPYCNFALDSFFNDTERLIEAEGWKLHM